jgi:hypothetical protein
MVLRQLSSAAVRESVFAILRASEAALAYGEGHVPTEHPLAKPMRRNWQRQGWLGICRWELALTAFITGRISGPGIFIIHDGAVSFVRMALPPLLLQYILPRFLLSSFPFYISTLFLFPSLF